LCRIGQQTGANIASWTATKRIIGPIAKRRAASRRADDSRFPLRCCWLIGKAGSRTIRSRARSNVSASCCSTVRARWAQDLRIKSRVTRQLLGIGMAALAITLCVAVLNSIRQNSKLPLLQGADPPTCSRATRSVAGSSCDGVLFYCTVAARSV